jgi:uncharacterized protein with PIN domain
MTDIAAQERESQLREMERTVMEKVSMTNVAGPYCQHDLEEHCDTEINGAGVHREYWIRCTKCGDVFAADEPADTPQSHDQASFESSGYPHF